MTPTTIPDLWHAASSAVSSQPLVTFYDDATGERVELSYATTGNWVAKTGNLLQDELGLEPGARAAILLPVHWLTPVWLLACWAAGLVAAVGGDPADADLVVAGPDTLEAARACGGERIALSLLPLGRRFPDGPPAGFRDYAAEVPGMPDAFAPYTPVASGDPALEAESDGYSQGDLLKLAQENAARWALTERARVLTAHPYDSVESITAGLLSPLVVAGSVVLCREPDPDRMQARKADEHVGYQVTGTGGGSLGVHQTN